MSHVQSPSCAHTASGHVRYALGFAEDVGLVDSGGLAGHVVDDLRQAPLLASWLVFYPLVCLSR